MSVSNKMVTILIADDDADDRLLIKEALQESHLMNDLYFVEDGEEVMDFLLHRNQFSDPKKAPRPGLILLDLNMPKKDGRECLKEIKENENLKRIPVVVLTTSKAEEDIYRTYNLGASSFIMKPVTFDEFIRITRELGNYWFNIVELPHDDN